MPVAVSLAELVKTPGTQHLWPVDFVALMAKADEEMAHNSSDRTVWAVIAGWCEEQEEHDLAGAFFWLSKRPEVRPLLNTNRRIYEGSTHQWAFSNLPEAISAGGDVPGDMTTLAGAVGVLAARIRRAREALA